jgi:hypothetical protein
MLKIKKPAGRGRAFEAWRGGDPINRKERVADIDIIVKHCFSLSGLMKPLFMPFYGITALSLQSSFLPNRVTQQRGWI